MSWLDKLFGKKATTPESAPAPEEQHSAVLPVSKPVAGNAETPPAKPLAGLEGKRFGHYSDNNKSFAKTKNWYNAEERFKEKNYNESFAAFFDYLCDEAESNVRFHPDGRTFTFELYQGSRKITGSNDGECISARTPLALMPQPATAVMRRLLELNYNLYYTRCSLAGDNQLYMMFESTVSAANPQKLYHGLRELATRADKQDDLLLADFSQLQPADHSHIRPPREAELELKYMWFRKWIQDALNRIGELNADSFSGAVAYLQLSLIYRIDFLMVPQAKLLSQLEKISRLYWEKKDEITLVERNQMMKEAVRKLLDITREEFAAGTYDARGTFAIAAPAAMDKVKDNFLNANKDAQWYVENKYPDLALTLNEYGPSFNQFSYSMPRLITELIVIYYAVIQSEYFKELGLREPLYDAASGQFFKERINAAVSSVIAGYGDKYADLKWDAGRLNYDALFDFGASFTGQIANLNLEQKRYDQ